MAQKAKEAKDTGTTQQKDDSQLEQNQRTQTPPSRQAGFNQPQGLSKTGTGRSLSRREQISPWDPFSLFEGLRTEMDRLFEDFGFGRGLARAGAGEFGGSMFDWSPQTEVFEREGQLVIQADLPGVAKEDVDVEIEDDRITIRGERRSENKQDEQGFYRSERSYGSFLRSIPIPEGIDPEQANANFRDGVLEITMPLPEQRSRKRRLEIGGEGDAAAKTGK